MARKWENREADADGVDPSVGQQCWLVSRAREGEVRHRLRAPGPVRIGRSAADGVLLTHPSVSREHAVLEWRDLGHGNGCWRISDCASASGTAVNGVPLQPRQSLALEPGDRIALGPVVLEFVVRAEADADTVIARIEPSDSERIDPVAATALEAQHVEAVLGAGASIHAATDPVAVADAAVDALARASGFSDVAFVRLDGGGAHHVVAARGSGADRVRVSPSVLARARFGPVVVSDSGGAADRHQTLARMNLARVVCVPVELGARLFGLLYVADGGAHGAPLEPVATLARSIASVAALALAGLERLHMTERLEAEQRAMFDGTMQALIASIDAKDPYTRGHSARVADFAQLIAAGAGLSPAECDRVRLCGLVHDIGKIGVPEAVLRKPDRLTAEEFALIAAHPVTGHDILRGIPQISDILPGVLHHHERYAGGGYPHGISGERIPLLGRLIAVADALDAMTTSRTYRGARPMGEALEEIARCAGTHFDPALARVVASLDRRALQGIVGLHVLGPGPAAAPAAPAPDVDQRLPSRRTA